MASGSLVVVMTDNLLISVNGGRPVRFIQIILSWMSGLDRTHDFGIYLLVALFGASFSYPGVSDWNACWDTIFKSFAPS
jgi:hypothetical protein